MASNARRERERKKIVSTFTEIVIDKLDQHTVNSMDNVSRHNDKTSEENWVAMESRPSSMLGRNGIRYCVVLADFRC